MPCTACLLALVQVLSQCEEFVFRWYCLEDQNTQARQSACLIGCLSYFEPRVRAAKMKQAASLSTLRKPYVSRLAQPNLDTPKHFPGHQQVDGTEDGVRLDGCTAVCATGLHQRSQEAGHCCSEAQSDPWDHQDSPPEGDQPEVLVKVCHSPRSSGSASDTLPAVQTSKSQRNHVGATYEPLPPPPAQYELVEVCQLTRQRLKHAPVSKMSLNPHYSKGAMQSVRSSNVTLRVRADIGSPLQPSWDPCCTPWNKDRVDSSFIVL